MQRSSIRAALIGLALALAAEGRDALAQPAVAAPYRASLSIETSLASLTGNPAQMAWGPRGRLYVYNYNAGIVSYRYNWLTGTLTDPIVAVESARGLGLGFHGETLYYSTLGGSLVKATDTNGNGVYGETERGELRLAIVQGLPTGDHNPDQIQIVGNTLYLGIGTRTINGHAGPLTGGQIDDYGGRGMFNGGQGRTWGDSAYNGTISWIQDLNRVTNQTNSANAFFTYPPALNLSKVRDDAGPLLSRAPWRLIVHSSGTRNPFGLCVDADGNLFFTNNYSRALTNGDGTTVQDIPRDEVGPDLSRSVHDQLFLAVPGADYGYSNDNWRGRSPMLTRNADGPNRVRSITFDNLANPGPYALHDPANPVGLGPSASADGCGFFYSPGLPAELFGNIFIARFNPGVTEQAAPPATGRTLRYADLVAVDVATGTVRRVAAGFNNPVAVLSDGANRLLVADFSVPANGGKGRIYALKTRP